MAAAAGPGLETFAASILVLTHAEVPHPETNTQPFRQPLDEF